MISYSILSSGNVRYVSVNSLDRQYNFTTLAPHTDYENRVYAINQIGQSPGSDFIVIKTGQARTQSRYTERMYSNRF